MKKSSLARAAAGVAFALSAAGAAVAETDAPATPPAIDADASETFFWGLQPVVPAKGFFSYRTPSDISGGDGKLSAWSAGGEIAGRLVNEKNIFYASVDYRFTDYRFEDVPAPFGNTERLHGFVRYVRNFEGGWGAFADFDWRIASEAPANIADGFSWRGGAGAKYDFSSDLSLYAGVQISTRLENDPLYLPFIGIDWRIDSHWSLNITNGLVVTYDVFEDNSLRIDLGCTYTSTDYRLRDINTGGGRRRVALNVQEIPLTLSVTKEFGRHAFVRGTVGGILFNQYEFRSDEDKIDKFKTDPSAFFGIEAGVRF